MHSVPRVEGSGSEASHWDNLQGVAQPGASPSAPWIPLENLSSLEARGKVCQAQRSRGVMGGGALPPLLAALLWHPRLPRPAPIRVGSLEQQLGVHAWCVVWEGSSA